MENIERQDMISAVFGGLRRLGNVASTALDRTEGVITRLGLFWTLMRAVEVALLVSLLTVAACRGIPKVWELGRECWNRIPWLMPVKLASAQPKAQRSPQLFEAKTMGEGVPFIGISHAALFGIADPETKRFLETEMVGRKYFEAQPLERGAAYVPQLLNANDPRTPVTLANGYMKRIVVRLIAPDYGQSLNGLVPLSDYEDYLRSIGK